eukprot:g10635.t1
MRGINLAGAEFGSLGQPYEKGYIYPSDETIAYFRGKGFSTVRLPFLWERLQPVLYGGFDGEETKRLRDTVERIRAAGMEVILDPHNYARYRDELIGSDRVPQSAFSDFWRRLAAMFAEQKGIIFGLMNEPYDIAAEDWVSAANGAISAIRQSGADNLVLVPGTSWTGAHSWFGAQYGTPNSEAVSAIIDPVNHYAFEVHQYLDADFSGKNEECSRAADSVEALRKLGDWLAAQGRQGYLGEFGVPTLPHCQSALTDIVATIESRPSEHSLADHWNTGVDKACACIAGGRRQLSRVVGMKRDIDGLFACLQRCDQSGVDMIRIDHWHAGMETNDLNMRDGGKAAHDPGKPAGRKHQRIAAGQDHFPDRFVCANVIQRNRQLVRGQHPVALRTDHFPTETEATVDRADVDCLQQNSVGIAVHDALDGTVDLVSDRIGAFLLRRHQLRRVGDELAGYRIIRIAAVDQ